MFLTFYLVLYSLLDQENTGFVPFHGGPAKQVRCSCPLLKHYLELWLQNHGKGGHIYIIIFIYIYIFI